MAPARQDKPVSTLPMLDEVLDLAPALEANWAAERAALPPGTLVNDGGDDDDGNEPGAEPDGEPSGEPDGNEEESFIDSFDLDSVPEAAREHVDAFQKQWHGSYTQKRQADRQEVAEFKREAEESQAFIDGLRNPDTMPQSLRLMDIDLSDPQTLEDLGISGVGQADDELDGLIDDDDEPQIEERLGRVEDERAEERQDREVEDREHALDDLADTELEKIEKAWDRKLDEGEDRFIRQNAESAPSLDGLPDYDSAAKMLKATLGREVAAEIKRRSEPGRGGSGGTPGGKTLDPSKEEDRIQIAAAAAEKAMASDN